MLNRIEKFDRKNGPLQIVHDFKFVALNVKDNYLDINEMSFEDKKKTIFSRIDKLYNNGYGGIVLNVDYNDYLKDEEAFLLLKEVIDYAYSKDMKIWIYDEQYYPSGSAGGLTLKDHPELESVCLGLVCEDFIVDNSPIRVPSPYGYSELKFAIAVPCVNGEPDFSKKVNVSTYKDLAGGLCWDAPNGEWRVYTFFLRAMYELTYLPQSLRASRRYPNLMSKSAFERFVEVTYKNGYEKHLGENFGDKIEAVFTDEPSLFLYRKYQEPKEKTVFLSVSIYDRPNANITVLPYIAWMIGIEDKFYDRFGYSLVENLPDMFEETENSATVKADYYRLVTELTEESFIGVNKNYLNSKGIKFSGHYYMEEAFDRHPCLYGDILNHLGGMDIPGCDRLNSDQNMLRYSVALKLASSAAHINGKDKVMIEASNMFDADQNMTLDKIYSAMSIMFCHGINVITSYYGENIMSADDMKKFCRYVAHLSSIFDGGKYKIDTLLFYPYEESCSIVPPESPKTECYTDVVDSIDGAKTCQYLLSNQILFDFINIDNLEKCTFENNELITAYGEKVKNIVLPRIDFVTNRTATFLNKAHKSGINIYFMGESRDIKGIDFNPMFIDKDDVTSSDIRLDEYDEYVNVMRLSFDDEDMYYIVNTINEDKKITVNIPNNNNEYFVYDPVKEIYIATEMNESNNGMKIDLDIPAGKSYIIIRK